MWQAQPATPRRPLVSRGAVLLGLAGIAAAAALALPPIPQDLAYHAFADVRPWAALPNAANVLSSGLFAAAGVAGLLAVLGGAARFEDRRERLPWLAFFASVALVGPGSAWYHLAPSNATLVWDRFPMSAAFAAIVSATVAERVSPRAGARALWPAIAAALLSVAYWGLTEARGAGDLGPYALVQLLAVVAIPVLVVGSPARYTRSGDWLVALALYAAAKLAEAGDALVFRTGGVVSGHTLKHVLAALGIAVLVRMLVRRAPVSAR